jgi:hypothetical protein
MKRTVTALGVALGAAGVLFTASPAHAQQQEPFGQKGQFILSADRLMPLFSFSHWSGQCSTNAGIAAELPSCLGVAAAGAGGVTKVTYSGSQTAMSFFYGSTANTNDQFYTVPRIGFDYTIVNNVTIGGDIVLFFTLGSNASTETDFSNGSSQTTTTSTPSTTIFGIAPRGGYILGLNNLFSLWLRGGFSFYTESQKSHPTNDSTLTNSIHQFSLDLDPQFVITPLPHIGITAGLTIDIPFGGGHSTDFDQGNTSQSFSAGSSIFYLGVTAGLLVHF